MIDSTTFTFDMLSNPTKLAKATIDAMEAEDTGSAFQINDPNNGFVMQMLANMAVFSKFSQKVDYVSSFFYPQRARNAEQLFPRLSQFDYVKLMASPATVPFIFAMSKSWVIDNAVYYDENYNRLEIPANSFITVGNIVYSMYHPIEILVNRNTNAVTAFYDTTVENPLNILATNMLLDVQEYTYNGIEWFQIQFNMYQFSREILNFTVGSEQGFLRTFDYEDQFYAVRVYTQNRQGNWDELDYSLSTLYYNYQTPTALIRLLPDNNQVTIEIPQIYFDNSQISQNIKIEIYTTKGAVNYSLSAADISSLQANFDTKSSGYAAPFDKAPSWNIFPTTTDIAGGSNAMDYAEIRDAVVNQRLYDGVAITSPQILQAGKRAGFDLSRLVDDLTERIYSASNILRDTNNLTLPTFSGHILLKDEALSGNPSTILNFSDGYYTLLPTTVFKIGETGLGCRPLSNAEINSLSNLTKSQLVNELNQGNYVRQPFHVTLLTTAKSPQASLYNLLSPKMISLVFDRENPHSAPQMSVLTCVVEHLASGTGGYRLSINVQRSSNIALNDISNLSLTLICTTKTGQLAYLPFTYSTTNDRGVDIWEAILSTNYHITNDNYITVALLDNDDQLLNVEIALNQQFSVLTSFIKSYDVNVPADPYLNSLLPLSYQLTQTAMAKQTITVSLGTNLSSQIYAGVNTSWGNEVYQIAANTVYHTTDKPLFQLDEQGILNTRYNSSTNSLEVIQLYASGDTPVTTSDLTYRTTGVTAVPSSGTTTTLTLNSSQGLLIGMSARGTNIPVNSVITVINGNNVTLSQKITVVIPASSEIIFTNPNPLLRTTVVQPAVGVQLSVASTQNLLVGQSVYGFNIPAGAKIASIGSATVFSLDRPTTSVVAANTLLTILNKTAPGVVKVAQGEIVRDVSGNPIVIAAASNQYRIPSILFDGRLFASEDPQDQTIVTTISELLENYANQISTIDAGLIEDSQVFYKPARTMGLATYSVGGGRELRLPLQLGFSVSVYVDTPVYNNPTLLNTMSDSIIRVVSDSLNDDIISISDIAQSIKETLGSNAVAIEMGDISNIDGLKLIALKEAGVKPSIETLLVLENDNSISRKPNVSINYLPKPDTSALASMVL